jgi:hypothetical protein
MLLCSVPAEPTDDRTLCDGQRRVRNDHLRVEHLPGTEPGTLWTRAVGAIEAKGSGLDLTHTDPAVRTCVLLREHHLLAADNAGDNQPLAESCRCLDRVRQPLTLARIRRGVAYNDAVDDDLDRMALVPLEVYRFIEAVHFAIHPNTRVSLL